MARRRRVDVPSADVLREVEEDFEVKSMSGRPAPIAQVAADAAGLSEPVDPAARAEAARDAADAGKLRQAEAEGRLAIDLPISEIQTDALTRDRASMDADAMAELRSSLAAHGQRMPIDVFELPDGGYGLISGYRRLVALREMGGPDASVRAMVRQPADASESYVTMVEENEIRADLSHYERGRIAVLAAGQGAFKDVPAAVNALFAAGSKAKRSKIRSFAAIHEEMGDLLSFPEAIGERMGLRISNALKAGQGEVLRQHLGNAEPGDAGAEAAVLTAALKDLEGRASPKVSRAKPSRDLGEPRELANGVTIFCERDRYGHAIRLEGEHVDEEFVKTVMETVHSLLRPK